MRGLAMIINTPFLFYSVFIIGVLIFIFKNKLNMLSLCALAFIYFVMWIYAVFFHEADVTYSIVGLCGQFPIILSALWSSEKLRSCLRQNTKNLG